MLCRYDFQFITKKVKLFLENESPSEDLLSSLTSSLTEAITALSKSIFKLKSILKLHEKHKAGMYTLFRKLLTYYFL